MTHEVYVHLRATDNKPYYVGKGSIKRDRAHDFHPGRRSKDWLAVHEEHGTIVFIEETNLTEEAAWELEALLTEALWECGTLVNKQIGMACSEEKKAKISAARIGKPRAPFSDEHRANMSAAKRGKPRAPFSDEHRARLSASKRDKPLTDEHRARLSAAKRGKTRAPFSDEHRANMSAAHQAAPDLFCPHCGKKYKRQGALDKHIEKCVNN